MSIGIGGTCRKVAEDDECVIYEYRAYNLNDPQFYGREKFFDGIILTNKTCLIEPEIHDKVRRMPDGKRKSFRKIIPVEIPIDEFIKNGEIQIENCSNAWKFLPNGTDYIAYRLCLCLLLQYQLNGELPEKYSCNM